MKKDFFLNLSIWNSSFLKVTYPDFPMQVLFLTLDVLCCLDNLCISTLDTVDTSKSPTGNLAKNFELLKIKWTSKGCSIIIIQKEFLISIDFDMHDLGKTWTRRNDSRKCGFFNSQNVDLSFNISKILPKLKFLSRKLDLKNPFCVQKVFNGLMGGSFSISWVIDKVIISTLNQWMLPIWWRKEALW